MFYSSKLGIMLKNKHEWNLVLLGAEAIASCFQGLEGRLFIKLEIHTGGIIMNYVLFLMYYVMVG